MNDMYNPKVSIIIPVYNGSNYLAEAIDSALSQTYRNLEIIVVNDGSCDNGATERIAKGYGDKIRYFYKENGGVSSALNFGIQHMTGEWFSWLSHDDLYMPQKIEHSVNVLRDYKGELFQLIVYTDGYLVRENKAKIRAFRNLFVPNTLYSGVEAACIMAKRGTLCGCCFLIHRSAFDVVGGFAENLRYSQDTLMWYRLFLNGYSIYFCGEKDVLSRVHKNQVTHTRKDLFVHDSLYIARELAPSFSKSENASQIYYRYVKRLTKQNCSETVKFYLDYAKDNKVLSSVQFYKLRFSCLTGYCVYRVKSAIRNIIVR